ncbi:TIGR04222 domain-containing membrane protein [Streptomyces sp. NPDC003635]
MNGGTQRPPEPYGTALLRGGPRAAVITAVVALHRRGVVEAGRPGTLRRSRTPEDGSGPWHPLEKAVRVGLYRPAGLRELLTRYVVRHALKRLRRELTAAGLLRSALPGPTRAGRRRLAELRRLHPLPSDAEGLTHEELSLAVALHGDRALTALLPGYAEAQGLVGRGRDRGGTGGRHSVSPITGLRRALTDEMEAGSEYGSGGYSSGGYGCGGGGGGGD